MVQIFHCRDQNTGCIVPVDKESKFFACLNLRKYGILYFLNIFDYDYDLAKEARRNVVSLTVIVY